MKLINHEEEGILTLFRKLRPLKERVIEVSQARSRDSQVIASRKVNVGTMPVPLDPGRQCMEDQRHLIQGIHLSVMEICYV